jgi:hypothetical protein
MILYNPTVSGSLLVTGSLTTTGTITSQTLVVQTITSSIEFNTGSTRNGTLSTNTHEFTGSVSVSGSITSTNTLSAYLGTISAGNTPATSSTTPVNPMLNLTNNRGIGMYFGGKYSGDYAQWIQVSDTGNLSVNYPLLLNPNGGNVGIGTSVPISILDVYRSQNSATSFVITNNNNGTGAETYVNTSNGTYLTSIGIRGTGNTSYFALDTNSGMLNYDGNTSLTINATNANAVIKFTTNGFTERMRIGSVGFTANIKTASDADSKTFMNSINATCGLMSVPAGTSLYLYSRDSSTNYRVILTSSTYFTGQHGNKPVNLDLKTNIQNYIGMIVSSNGTYHSVNPITQEVTTGKDAIQISEALPEIKLTDTDQDKAVWGVVTNIKNDNYNTDGTIETDNSTEWGDRLGSDVIRINGLGEGAIWITNINGNIENGDYICSSVIPGYGRKQNDDLLHNYTVAKSTMNCDFNLNNDGLYVCEEFQHDGITYKKAFIGCTYHCS